MIFLCFANKDRYTIAESILYHLENFGIDVWYDRHSLIIGDNRPVVNFDEGIRKNRYSILLITPNIEHNICANEELVIVKEQLDKNEMKVFPILYNITAEQLPPKYYWIKEYIYREVTDKTGTLLTVSSIVCRYLKDQVDLLKYPSLHELICSNAITDQYLKALLYDYQEIDNHNFNSKMTVLHCVNKYLITFFPQIYPRFCMKPFGFYFSFTKLNLEINFKEITILEYCILIMIHKSLFNTNF